jgi:hypothetical protein
MINALLGLRGRRSALALLVLMAATGWVGGCATITRSGWEQLMVESDPPGAFVQLSNGVTGITPVRFGVRRTDDLAVTVTKEGYEPATITVKSQWADTGKAGMAGNVPLVAAAGAGLVGVGVDLATGATRSHVPNPVKVTLVPLKPAETPQPAVDSTANPESEKHPEPAGSGGGP